MLINSKYIFGKSSRLRAWGKTVGKCSLRSVRGKTETLGNTQESP